jgi:hypothetical protein
MRKLFVAFTMLLFSYVSFGQAINDQAIIPVSVTLNSILRLTVVSGGNIDFVVNTIDQYTNGINALGTNARYQTIFTVSCSRDFDVNLRAEDATLMGQDNPANTLLLNNVGYQVAYSGVGGVIGTNWTIPSSGVVANTVALAATATIITGIATKSAGDGAFNKFTLQWKLGTVQGTMNPLTLLAQSKPADRYITNVYLDLTGK